MIVTAKEIMARIAKDSLAKGEITAEEYDAVAEDLGIPTLDSTIYVNRIDTKTGKVLRNERINLKIVAEVVFLSIDSGRITKTWRMGIKNWNRLNNPEEDN